MCWWLNFDDAAGRHPMADEGQDEFGWVQSGRNDAFKMAALVEERVKKTSKRAASE